MKTRVSLWILITLLSAGFALAGMAKLTGNQNDMFIAWGYTIWFAKLIAVLELLGVVLLWVPAIRKYSILLLNSIMIGAAYTHLVNGETMSVIRPAIFASLLCAVWILQTKAASQQIGSRQLHTS